jgi:UDP-N-acetylglucosamine 2-epimerase (non-hydrolysing)
MNPLKLLLVAGARPNFMKIAPLVKAIDKHNQRTSTPIEFKIVHTGQHYDIEMSEIFFRELDIPSPDINLEVGSASHATQTANIMIRFEQVLLAEKPDWVIVVGDINSTMACTLVASKLSVKVAHVEAGLRSFDRTMPEEINRLVTDALADMLFTPSPDADENLRKEGIPDSKIKLVGNIMIDTLVANLKKARATQAHKKLDLEEGFVYVTLHRPSNVDDKKTLSTIMDDLNRLASQIPVVFPMHPRTRKMLETFNIASDRNGRFLATDPIGYHDSICLAEHARFVLTDSGGLQEETTFFRTPCLTLRPNTERPITITEGSNKLTSAESLWSDIQDLLNGPLQKGNIPALWDGKTAERIIEHLKNHGTQEG